MHSLQSLPPLFLLPRWSPVQLLSFSLHHYRAGPKPPTRGIQSSRGRNGDAQDSHERRRAHSGGYQEHAREHAENRTRHSNLSTGQRITYGIRSYGRFKQRTEPKAGGIRTQPLGGWRKDRQSTHQETGPGELLPGQVVQPQKQLQNGSKLSLLEELFPEQAKSSQKALNRNLEPDRSVPILTPPNLGEIYNEHGELKPSIAESEGHKKTTSSRSNPAADPCVLVMHSASPHLSEADFRRIAPKGFHIEEWRGQEDPLKVIPVRDQKTMNFLDHYYLVFPSMRQARAYKARAESLHVLSQTHTPTAIHSALLPAVGTIVGEEDIGMLLREYTLAPPSQALNLRLLRSPHTVSAKSIIAAGGLPRLAKPVVRRGRSILLRVEGFKAATWHIMKMLEDDGNDRGMQWYPNTVRGAVEEIIQSLEGNSSASEKQFDEDVESDLGEEEDTQESLDEPRKHKDRHTRRWLITFEDEKESRRFIRTWHMRPFPMWKFDTAWGQREPLPIVHAEFVW